MFSAGFAIIGSGVGKFYERDGGPFGRIELYDIGDDEYIGAYYTGDKSKQIQPLSWHGPIARKMLAEYRETVAKENNVSKRPRIHPPKDEKPFSRLGLRHG